MSRATSISIWIALLLCCVGTSRAATNAAFRSADGRFELTVEFLDGNVRPQYRERPIIAVMTQIDRKPPVKMWEVNLKASHWLPADVYIPDHGKFAVVPGYPGGWTLLKPGKSIPTATIFQLKNSLPRNDCILELDELNNEPIVRIWQRALQKWTAFYVNSEKETFPGPELIAKWNEATRKNILARFQRVEADAMRAKLKTVSKTLSNFSEMAVPAAKPGDLQQTFFTFLALQKNPVDRALFERFLSGGDADPLRPPSIGMGMMFGARGRRFIGGDPYFFFLKSAFRGFGDELLAIYEGNVTDFLPYGERPEKRFYLGEVSGAVRLPAPVINDSGRIRIHLVPANRERNDWLVDQEDSIEEQLMVVKGGQFDLTDQVSFAFETVAPGKYFLKAIWDKRRPFTDREKVGPGDYESDWIGPITVAAGKPVKNLFLQCGTRAAEGEAYYKADELMTRQWQATGGLSLFSHGRTDGARREVFSGPPPVWILKTNFLAVGKPIELTRIVMMAGLNEWNETAPLHILWRNGPGAGERSTRVPMDLCIVDAAGREFRPESIGTTARAEMATFKNFPRFEKTWRLVGYGPTGTNELLFDFALTNHVRVNVEAKLASDLFENP